MCSCASAFLVPGIFHRKYSLDPLTGLLPGLASAKETKIPQLISQTVEAWGKCSAHSPTPSRRELLPSREQWSQCIRYSHFHLKIPDAHCSYFSFQVVCQREQCFSSSLNSSVGILLIWPYGKHAVNHGRNCSCGHSASQVQ